MLIDLVANRITFLTLAFDSDEFHISAGEPLISQLQAIGGRQAGDRQQNVTFVSQYKVSNRIQRVSLVVPEVTTDVALLVHARVGGERRRRVSYTEVETGLRRLGQLGVHGTGQVHIVYEAPIRSFKPVIPLPLRISQPGALPFDRLMGFRVGQLDGTRTTRSLIMDSVGSSLQLSLSFKEELAVNENLLSSVLRSSKNLVMPMLAKSREVEQWYNLGLPT